MRACQILVKKRQQKKKDNNKKTKQAPTGFAVAAATGAGETATAEGKSLFNRSAHSAAPESFFGHWSLVFGV